MTKIFQAACVCLLAATLSPSAAFADCTSLIVTKGASADGSVMVSHSDDNDLADQSIVHIPARDWPEGATRKVYPSAVAVGDLPEYDAYLIPRLVLPEGSHAYDHPGRPQTVPLGEIPQVAHTYAYLDGNYGIVNEHGLMFGESTDRVVHQYPPDPKKRLFYSAELSRVALERCRTAREAILLMGDLIETHGFYGTGETLPVGDAEEAWVMEMAPLPDGEKGGLWVAQRVPDGHFCVIANEFRIRDIEPGRDDQLYGRMVFPVANRARGKPDADASPFDWLTLVSKGEYAHPYYSLRRVWRALSLAAPSLGLPSWVEDGTTRAYPFSVKPDRKLTLDDVKRIHRDYYEGTEFDLTRGVAAGPFGCPVRYLGPDDPSAAVGDPGVSYQGSWERPISMFYAGFTFITQVRSDLPRPLAAVSWLALNTPAESVFVPLAVGPVPESYRVGDPRVFDWSQAWTVYNLVGEYANLKYSHMIRDIRERAGRHEGDAEGLVAQLRERLAAKAAADPEAAAAEFAETLTANADRVLDDWRMLFTELVVKYRQGFLNTPEKMAQRIPYPREWLDLTNYADGPVDYREPAKR